MQKTIFYPSNHVPADKRRNKLAIYNYLSTAAPAASTTVASKPISPPDAQDIAILCQLYNQAIDLYFTASTAAADARRANNSLLAIEHSTRAAMASAEAVRIDGLRNSILMPNNNG